MNYKTETKVVRINNGHERTNHAPEENVVRELN